MSQIRTINRSTCESARAYTQETDSQDAEAARQNGQSFLPRVAPDCTTGSPDELWRIHDRSR